jgi:radical SAM superfamily enzyme YgiQ (UPF0313 family)
MRTIRSVLFINPNRYQHPPVPPLAAEYLADALERKGVHCRLLDLCFSADPQRDISRAVEDASPDAVFMTIRNVDSVLWPGTEFFLPEIRSYVHAVRECSDAPVVIGGAGLKAAPEDILSFLGADIAVVGPGEGALDFLLDTDGLSRNRGKVIRADGADITLSERQSLCDSPAYENRQGIMGFRTHSGCSSGCAYCIEAGVKPSFRMIESVLGELRVLSGRGHTNLHLCDSEFNEDVSYCESLLEAMGDERLGLAWALYMQTGKYTERMFPLLARTGAYLITLTVDTLDNDDAYWRDVDRMIYLSKDNGIRMSVDLLTGFPDERMETTRHAIETLDRSGADEVVVNSVIRLYRGMRLTRKVMDDPGKKQYLMGDAFESCVLLPSQAR